MVRALVAVLDGNVAGSKIDQAAGNEEWRHAPRPLFLQHKRGLGNAFDAADAGADHDAGAPLILVVLGLPTGIVHRLLGRGHRIDDEVVNLALLLRLHPLVGIVGAVSAVAARDYTGDLAGDIGYVKRVDVLDPAFARDDALPRRFNATSQRRDHAEPGNNDASHNLDLWP